jgi:hypothetical protein
VHELVDKPQIDQLRVEVRHRYSVVLALRRVVGVAGAVLLGGALVWAPVAAFTGEMVTVTKAGLAGVALLVVMKLLPRRDAAAQDRLDPLDDER